MKAALLTLVVTVLCVVFFGTLIIGERNALMTRKEDIRQRASALDRDFKSRAQLIPQVTAAIQRSGHQDRVILTEAAHIETILTGAESLLLKDRASAELSKILNERSKLRLDKTLQDGLSNTENQIAVDRSGYNQAIKNFNTALRKFPKNIAAAFFGLHRDNNYLPEPSEAKPIPQGSF